MDDNELLQPMMAAQAFHVGRVAMQVEKLGIQYCYSGRTYAKL